MPKRPFEILDTPEQQPLMRPRTSPLTPRDYGSTPRAEGVPRGLAGSSLPQRLSALGRRTFRRAIRAFEAAHGRGGRMRTLASTVRRRLFSTPLASARAAAVVEATEALAVYVVWFSFVNWVMNAVGADKFIAYWTDPEDWANDKDDVPKNKQSNTSANSTVVGDGNPVAPCMPTYEYPNAFTLAMGTAIASPA